MKKKLITILAIAIVSIIAIVLIFRSIPESSSQTPLVPQDLLSRLKSKDTSEIDTSRLADNLTPPTNKWFSGLALQETPMTVFPTPLSFTPTDTSFTYRLPKITTSDKLITSVTADEITVEVKDATRYRITRYDDLSVDLTYADDQTDIARVTITAGSPYIYLTSISEELELDITGPGVAELEDSDQLTFKARDIQYGISGHKNSSFSTKNSNATSKLPRDSFLALYVSPSESAYTTLSRHAGNKILETAVDYQRSGDTFQTSISISTENNQPTLIGYLPHQTTSDNAEFTYETIYGGQRVASGNKFSFDTPKVDITGTLDLSSISGEDRQALVSTLKRDIDATQYPAVDTYASGKELYRSSQLLMLADQLGEEQLLTIVKTKLRNQLNTWYSPEDNRSNQYFYFNPRLKSIVGEEASFGSEDINDHHFHFGYFIYASAILAEHDSNFLEKNKDMVDLLVADIANYHDDEPLPPRRMFDPYFGHSWASGSSPFNDGNNQESSSEALNAWTGVGLWANQTKNNDLLEHAEWMISNEAKATKLYWMNVGQQGQPKDSQYKHKIFSLNWGGKRDYATFFSDEPAAKLGILLIPLNPTMASESVLDRSVIAGHLQEAISEDYQVPLGDYILMYSALVDKKNKLQLVRELPEKHIDSANSRSYMMAWVLSQK